MLESRRWRKPELRERARALRRAGASIAAIQAAVPAAKSSISMWVRDIPLDEEHRRALEAANPAVNGR